MDDLSIDVESAFGIDGIATSDVDSWILAAARSDHHHSTQYHIYIPEANHNVHFFLSLRHLHIHTYLSFSGNHTSISLLTRRRKKGEITFLNVFRISVLSSSDEDALKSNHLRKSAAELNTSGRRKFNNDHNSFKLFYS